MYSTCTLNPGENGEVVRKYMETGGTDEGFNLIEEKTFLQGVDDCDGFYYAVLKKKADISSMYPEELEEYLTGLGYPKFRSAQVFSWLHEKYVGTAEDMTNLPKDMREKLEKELIHVEEETRQVSKIDGTIKFLFRMEDGQMIETVFMKYHHGNSICISSQCGCAMGCKFCASTIGGCIRNLTAGEMLGQIYAAMRLTGEKISNVVVMGTGEPMQNYDNLIRFIKLLTHEKGYNLSVRNITVSTCGVVPKIEKLAKEGLPITLALSLHAPTDELRRTLMPIANRYTLKETLEACEHYFDKTGRRLTAEYSLMHGINDTAECGETLGALLKGRGFHVNLIPVNPVNETDFKPGNASDIRAFKKILEKYGINVTIRRGLGADIDAACGQLRRRRETSS
jgi:23S rRNA (adenine2503-C2)-methyltransferase